MKKMKILSILLLSLLVITSCEEIDDAVTTVEGGLVEIKNPSVNYIVGNTGPYASSIRIFQGTVKTVKVDIYKSFNTMVPAPTEEEPDAKVAASSNEVLFRTFDITSTDQNSLESFNYTFGELIADLTIDGTALPGSDGEYQIGDYWELRYVSTKDDGSIVQQKGTTAITVATRFAGKYKTLDAVYGRNTADAGVEWFYTESDWPAETVIQSIDAITYKVVEFMGPFDANEWYFQVDPVTLAITYPAEWDGEAQEGNGQPFIDCTTNPADFAAMGLDCLNYVELDEVNGKDKLYMTYGYYTPGSGPRTFFHLMEKIVE